MPWYLCGVGECKGKIGQIQVVANGAAAGLVLPDAVPIFLVKRRRGAHGQIAGNQGAGNVGIGHGVTAAGGNISVSVSSISWRASCTTWLLAKVLPISSSAWLAMTTLSPARGIDAENGRVQRQMAVADGVKAGRLGAGEV